MMRQLQLPGIPSHIIRLTKRETQIVELVSEGVINKIIAHKLGLSEGTIKVYLSHLYLKLGLENKTQLAVWATNHGYYLDGSAA